MIFSQNGNTRFGNLLRAHNVAPDGVVEIVIQIRHDIGDTDNCFHVFISDANFYVKNYLWLPTREGILIIISSESVKGNRWGLKLS